MRQKHIPRKQFGQHFLTDRNILAKIADAAELKPSDVVLEIGPGLGHLTATLAETGAKIVAVEVDRELAASLRSEFSGTGNVILLQGDFMSRPPEDWLTSAQQHPPYKVVANLPYYITSAILRRLLEAVVPPTKLVVMVQREVAQQIVAKPPHANLLGISIQFYGHPRIVDIVPAGAFYPRPKVDSAIVRIDVDPSARQTEPEVFFRIVRAGFGSKRKQLKNALAHGLNLTTERAELALRRANIDPTRRAETLTLEDWERLARTEQKISTDVEEKF